MDQYVTSEETVTGPFVGPENPGPGPENPAPDAASSESGGPEVVAVVPRGQQKSRLRAEKLERVKKQLRKSKPAGATAPSWAYHGTGGVNEDSEEEVESEEEDDSEENQDGRKNRRTYLEPLDWWRKKSVDFPHLSILARRVLATPATQAGSERLVSCAGNIVTNNRNKIASSTVELLVLLRHSWKTVEEREASNAAARGVRKGST